MMQTFEDYLEFEKSKIPFYNELYKYLGCEIISREDNEFWDCKLKKDKYIFTVEEKARKQLWDDILIEIIQDTESDHLGWIYYTKADFLVYGMFDDKVTVYRLPIRDFRIWFDRNKDAFEEVESKKGWGITINKIVPIIDIPQTLIKRIL